MDGSGMYAPETVTPAVLADADARSDEGLGDDATQPVRPSTAVSETSETSASGAATPNARRLTPSRP
jgi:hypothetical protein